VMLALLRVFNAWIPEDPPTSLNGPSP
jgi:hypothetical protein